MTIYPTKPPQNLPDKWEIRIGRLEKKGMFKDYLEKIKDYYPDRERIHIFEILKVAGIKGAIWSLCCFPYKQYGLFLADVMEKLYLPIWERRYTSVACWMLDPPKPRKAIEAIRRFCYKKIDENSLMFWAREAHTGFSYLFMTDAVYWAANIEGGPDTVLKSISEAVAVTRDYDYNWEWVEKEFIKFVGTGQDITQRRYNRPILKKNKDEEIRKYYIAEKKRKEKQRRGFLKQHGEVFIMR